VFSSLIKLGLFGYQYRNYEFLPDRGEWLNSTAQLGNRLTFVNYFIAISAMNLFHKPDM